MGTPSSVRAGTPAAFSAAKSVRACPFCPAGEDVYPGWGGLVLHLPDDLRAVCDGPCVGHGHQGGHAAFGGGGAAGGHRLLGLKARFPQVDVQVHQSGGGRQPAGVQDLRAGNVQIYSKPCDLSVFDVNIQLLVYAVGGVDDPSAPNQ